MAQDLVVVYIYVWPSVWLSKMNEQRNAEQVKLVQLLQHVSQMTAEMKVFVVWLSQMAAWKVVEISLAFFLLTVSSLAQVMEIVRGAWSQVMTWKVVGSVLVSLRTMSIPASQH